MGRLVYRGGSWNDNPGFLRSKIRFGIPPVIRFGSQGFRVVEDIGDDRYRVVRGGSWDNGSRILRSAYRNRVEPDFHNIYQGFRVVEDL